MMMIILMIAMMIIIENIHQVKEVAIDVIIDHVHARHLDMIVEVLDLAMVVVIGQGHLMIVEIQNVQHHGFHRRINLEIQIEEENMEANTNVQGHTRNPNFLLIQ